MGSRPNSQKTTRLGQEQQKLNLPRQPMLVLAVAGIAGIAFDRVVSIETEHWSWLIGTAILFVLLTAFIFKQHRVASMLFLFAMTMGMYHHRQYNHYPENNLSRFVSEQWQPLFVEGHVASPVQQRPDTLANQRSEQQIEAWQSIFEIDVVAVRDGYDYRPATGRSRVVVDGMVTGLLHGDRIRLGCHGQCIVAASNPGEVDLQSIYRSRRQLVRLHANSPEQVRLMEHGRWTVTRLIHWIGDRGHHAIVSHLDHDSAALAEALVLGRREAVDRQVRDRLLETGTIHLLAVSGLHVGIVAVAVSWLVLLLGVPRTGGLICVIVCCLVYMLITGARPPVIRAATLISIFLIGQILGRRTDSMNTLATAAVLLMLIDPLSMSQVGTHLSFLAVATIVLSTGLPETQPPIDPIDELLQSRWAKFVCGCRQVYDTVAQVVRMSFWIWCLGLPLVWYHFHIVSPISIVANVVLWIPLTIALISGLLTAVLGGIWLPLGAWAGAVCQWALQQITWIVESMATIDGAFYWVPSPPIWLVLGFYAGIVAMAFPKVGRYRKPIVFAFVAIWIVAASLISIQTPRSDRFVATFIDVGHGTSVLMQFPNGQCWLYDAGRLGDAAFARWPIEAVLWSEGIRRLDGIIVSHADADHYNAIPGLLERFGIDKLVASHEMFPSTKPGVVELQHALADHNINVEAVAVGDRLLEMNDVHIQVLHPPKQHLIGKDNANSIVLRIDCFGHSLLLPGDLEAPGTALLLAQAQPLAGGVLMAPHHGSLSQDIYPILRWSRPSAIVASGGERATDPRVIRSLSETGAEVFITARDGAVRVQIDASGIAIRTWNRDRW